MKKIEKMDLFINKLYELIKDEDNLVKCADIVKEKTRGTKRELIDYITSIFPLEILSSYKVKKLKWTKEFKQKMKKHRLEKKEFLKTLQSGKSNENKKLMDSMIKKDKLEIIIVK